MLTGANKSRLAASRASPRQVRSDRLDCGRAWQHRLCPGAGGKKLERAGDVPVEGGTTPNPTTPEEVARAQRQLTALQWVIPVLTGAVLVVNARMGEQQRPAQVSKGLVRRLLPGR